MNSKSKRQKGWATEATDKLYYLFLMLPPLFVCFAIYYALGHYIVATRYFAYGTVLKVARDQGENHVTNAVVMFPLADGSGDFCTVKTWFRGSDAGIKQNASIKVIPTQTCKEPWFPDHIPPTIEPICAAVVCAFIGIILYWVRKELSEPAPMSF